MKPMRVETAGMTDRGKVRTDNQDQFFVGELTRSIRTQSSSLALEAGSQLTGSPRGQLFMVADGMGGHRAGNEASGLAIQFFIATILNRVRWLVPRDDSDESMLVDDLKRMLTQAHAEIKRQSEVSSSLSGMGTTFTMAYVNWPRMYVVHAGDTRCYLHRRGGLKLLTRDHTVANQLMEAGRLDPSALERSPWSNVLINALGAGAEEVFAEITKVELLEGDRVLLCSDGLNKHVDDEAIEGVLGRWTDAHSSCEALVRMANDGGGSDNITVVLARWEPTAGNEVLPIISAMPAGEKIYKEIELPAEESETTDLESLRISTSEFNDTPTDPMIGGS